MYLHCERAGVILHGWFCGRFEIVVDSLLPLLTTHISLGAFVICWTPGLVTLLLDGLLGKASHANAYEKFCLVIAECNSLVNPIIYSLRDDEMRRTFKRILCCLCWRSADQQGEPSPVEIASPLPEVHRVRVDTDRHEKAHIVIITLLLLHGFWFLTFLLSVSCRFSLATPMQVLISNLTYQYLALKGTRKFLFFNSLVDFVNVGIRTTFLVKVAGGKTVH